MAEIEMEDNPENYDFSGVTPILTQFAKFLSEYTKTSEKPSQPVRCTAYALVFHKFLNELKEANSEILTEIGLCPQFGEQILAVYLKDSVQIPPGTFTVDTPQSRGLSAVPGYHNAVNQEEPVIEIGPFNESTPVGEDDNISQAGLSYNDLYQVEGVNTVQGPYYSGQAPQSELDFIAPIGDYDIDNEELASYQHRDEINYDERSINQDQYEAAVANSQISSIHQEASRPVLSTNRRKKAVKTTHKEGKSRTRNKRNRKAGNSQASSYHQQASRSLLFTDEGDDVMEPFDEQGNVGARSRRKLRSQASSRHRLATPAATNFLPKKAHNNCVEGSRVQKKTITSSKGRPLKMRHENDMSRIHFYVLEQKDIWRKGDRLHIPVSTLPRENEEKSVEGGTVVMNYISRSGEGTRRSLWECRCVGVNGHRVAAVTAQSPTDFVSIVKHMGLKGPVISEWSDNVMVIRKGQKAGTVTDFKAMALFGKNAELWGSLQA